MNLIKKITRTTFVLFLLSALLFFIAGCKQEDASGNEYNTWNQYGGGADQSKYFDADEITKENVKQLELAWTYPAGDSNAYFFNPIIVDTIMYVLAKNFSLVAISAISGKEIWIHANLTGIARRGLNYWESKDKKDKRLIFSLNNTLQAIDASTGKSIMSFGTNGMVDLREGLERDPLTIRRVQSATAGAVFEDLVLVGSSPGEAYFSPPGHVRAYNIVTGKLVWTFHTIPQPGEFGYETWPKDAYKYMGGVNAWGEISVDTKRGIAYFPIGSPTYDYYGGDRIGSNLFGNCLLALDARTGKRLWHFQTVHHDLWDYDLSAAPQLVTVDHDGKKVDAVAQATKNGFMFVFDRVSGEPLWPIEEKPFPASAMPGEQAWPTQPVPTVIPSFSRHEINKNDLNPYFTEEEKQKWIRRIDSAKSGLFQPPSDKYETMIMPGATGGVNFGNTAANPKKGLVFVQSQEFPSIYKLDKVRSPQELMSADEQVRVKAFYTKTCQTCHGENMSGGVGPSLVNAGLRISFDEFKTLIGTGRGQMPAFPHVDEKMLTDVFRYMGGFPGRPGFNLRGGDSVVMPAGPVVASGGAPVDKTTPPKRNPPLTEYPDSALRFERYNTGYGLSWPDVLSPPWAVIVAYDLNTGTIKWKQPLGEDGKAFTKGIKNTGAPNGSQRKGMIITSTGIVFSTGKGGKLYAFDEDNGTLLWETTLPHETTAMPSMFEIDGKQYIVINCTSPFTKDSIDHSKKEGAAPGGYFVYALPVRK